MNKTQFAEILKNPESLSEDTLAGIREIIEEYPFFQIGRMLWLKNLHKLDKIKYNSELKISAAYIADRTKLFQLINNIGKPIPEAPHSETVENTSDQESPIQETAEEAKVNVEEHKTSVTVTDNYLNASDDLSDDESSIYDFAPKLKLQEEKENEIQDIVLPAADLLDYEMTSSSSYSLPDLKDVEEVDSGDNRSFSDWLHIMHYSTSPQKEEKPRPKNRGMDLIDNFLNSNPQIIPDPAKKPKNVDLGEDSTHTQDDILTETLAEIHIKQGNKNKAIAIFEKLRLKYPEKSVYFARRIKELKEN
ncbi:MULTISPECIES: tetratricopeptide repeat protein [unclassified Saccharicrinis]|uniref:tetratricopeptide repeat protein n=1 Tax=unclassified Saccharicrinis TaxID=2646859 RepID=UPI003D33D9F5